MLATIRDDTWNVLKMQNTTPNSKSRDYSDIPGGGHKTIIGPAHMVKDGHHHRKAPSRKCPNWSKDYFDLCDPDLWPLTLTFGMDITFVNGYYSWNLHEDTMRATFEKGVTNRRTDRQTERSFMKLHGRSWKWYEKNKIGKI